ncbi:MAG: ribonuclease H-like domain-containing protein [Actinobacteria bacterium]|nr:ribonuclease H-like domain-containing protein [Actinomycetota bacterium]
MHSDAGAFFHATGQHELALARIAGWPDEASRRALAVAGRDPRLHAFALGEAAFLDTETTGLAGGTGTYAFLVGVGWIERGALRVDQFFMRDPADEPAMLQRVDETLRRFAWVISFNGLAFDLPLLNTRFILNRRRSPLPAMTPLDLLLVARRLWKYRLRDRSLDGLERGLLDVQRRSDVPSHLIPDIYFRYLRTGDARLLGPVFEHNRQDIVSMALILARACEACRTWREAQAEPAEVLGVARAHALAGELETAHEAYARALELGLEDPWDLMAQTAMSVHHKCREDWEEALAAWRALSAGAGRTAIWALVELAKYDEHRRNDYAGALARTARAIDLAERAYEDLPAGLAVEALQHRLARLRRRAAGRRVRADPT